MNVEPEIRVPTYKDFLEFTPKLLGQMAKMQKSMDMEGGAAAVIFSTLMWLSCQASTRIATYDVTQIASDLAPHFDWSKIGKVEVIEYRFSWSELGRLTGDDAEDIEAFRELVGDGQSDFEDFVLNQYLAIYGPDGGKPDRLSDAEFSVMTNAAHEAMARVGRLAELDGEYVSAGLDGELRSIMSLKMRDRIASTEANTLDDDILVQSTMMDWMEQYK